MFLVRATETSKTKVTQVLTRIEESALLTHQLKLAYFVHIVETEANLAEFEVFLGQIVRADSPIYNFLGHAQTPFTPNLP